MKRFLAVLIVACSSPQGSPPSEAPVVPATASTPPVSPPPPDAPRASVSATPPPASAAPPASAKPPARATPPSSPEFELAKKAALADDMAKVRELLGPIVMQGKGTQEEVQLVSAACKSMRDRPCVQTLKKLYPDR